MKTFIANLDAIGRHPYFEVEFAATDNENYHIKRKGHNITIEYQRYKFGIKFHETKHVYQLINGQGMIWNANNYLAATNNIVKANNELEAYRLQYALQSRNGAHDMPTSNKIYSVYDFQGNYKWLGSITSDDGLHPYKDAANEAEDYINKN